jgi:putative MATE family efflux protein
MGVMPVHRLLLSMSIPMVISMMVAALYNVVDSYFVAKIGEDALTAVSLVFPIQSLMISVAVGTGVGLNAFLSKSLGEKNYGRANRSAMNGIFLAWVSCAAFMLIGFFGTDAFFSAQTENPEIIRYGRSYMSIICIFSLGAFSQITCERILISTGRTYYAMISQSAGAIINIVLDPIMIFGLFGFPRLEVAGAAIATVIGQTSGALVAVYFGIRKNHDVKMSWEGIRPEPSIIGRIYSVGLPSILMGSLGSVMVYGLNNILIAFTSTAVAVFGVYFKLQSFIFMPVFGLNNGMVPIIAYNYGAGNKERITATIKLSVMYATGIMILGMAVFQIFPSALFRLFNATDEMMSIGVSALRIISFHFLFAGFCIVSLSVFQALGYGKESLFVAGSRQLLFLLPIAWLLSLTGHLDAVWLAFPAAECATFLLCVIRMKSVYDRKIKTI